jgi:hypothetical protein
MIRVFALFLFFVCTVRVRALLFKIKSISQSNPVINGSNIITVTLQCNQSLEGNSSITMTGFNSIVIDSPIPLLSVSGGNSGQNLFQSGSESSSATFSSGSIILTISNDKVMNETFVYAFSFVITNPSTVPAIPSISIELDGTSEAMELPNIALIGVTNGMNPLVRCYAPPHPPLHLLPDHSRTAYRLIHSAALINGSPGTSR